MQENGPEMLAGSAPAACLKRSPVVLPALPTGGDVSVVPSYQWLSLPLSFRRWYAARGFVKMYSHEHTIPRCYVFFGAFVVDDVRGKDVTRQHLHSLIDSNFALTSLDRHQTTRF